MRTLISLGLVALLVAVFVMFVRDRPADQSGTQTIDQGVKISKSLDLAGDWKSEKQRVTAKVENGTIEVLNTLEDGGFSRLWYGTFDNPEPPRVGVTSKGIYDVNKLYLSSAETKDFVYDNGMLKFQISMMGTTRVVELKRV